MTLFQVIAILISLAAAFAYANHRWLRLPATIGLMVMALGVSLAAIITDRLGLPIGDHLKTLVESIDFDEALLHGLLGALLFAGALHVDLGDIARQKGTIAVLAVVGTLVSTAIIGFSMWQVANLLGLALPLVHALLFGALISPTDPIAVLGILKQAKVAPSLEAKIAGESLFNDGVGVVVFMVMLGLAEGNADVGPGDVAWLFAREAIGGVAFGLVLGYIAFRMLKTVDHYPVEILITLAVTTGGYALAEASHISAPIAAVVSGLLIGNHGRLLAMSARTREHLDVFWELVDEILNAVLFVLIGLEVLVLHPTVHDLTLAAIALPVVFLARLVSVGVPIAAMSRWRSFSPHAVKILTWGGLRGGISVALALALPAGGTRQLLVSMTYVVVVFTILVQGLTMGPLVRRLSSRR